MPPSKYSVNTYRKSGAKLPAAKVEAWIKANFDVKPRKDGEELRICNPFNGDTGYHLNINIENLGVHDWRGDEWAGPVNPKTNKRNCSFVKFVQLYRKISYAQAVKEIVGASEDLRSYLRPENRSHDNLKTIAVDLPTGTERLHDANDKQASIVKHWLRSRGYVNEDIDRFDIYYLGVDCYWPYYEFDSLVYWQSRNRFNKVYRFPDLNIYDTKGNVVAKTDGSKGDFLYGFDDCERAKEAIITESIFGQYTLNEQTLASGGAALTDTQIDKIQIIGPKYLILSPDNDNAGIKSIISNYEKLHTIHKLFYSIPPRLEYTKDGKSCFTKDWNELFTDMKLSRAEIRQIHDKRIERINISSLNKLYDLMKSQT